MDRRIQLAWKLRRIAAGFRQQDLAALLGMSSSRYSAIERGDLKPTDEEADLIEKALPGLPGDNLAPNATNTAEPMSNKSREELIRRELSSRPTRSSG
jgi:transcriptional regulator with XRE-family HTH domain